MGDGSAMIRCTNCKHPNEEGAAFCANCHHFLAWESTAAAGGEPDQEETPSEVDARARVEPTPESRPEPLPEPAVPPAPPAPVEPVAGPAAVRDLVAAIDASGALAGRRDRADLSERLAGVRTMVQQRAVTVAVVGEFKRGKSTLVNALLQTAACPGRRRHRHRDPHARRVRRSPARGRTSPEAGGG